MEIRKVSAELFEEQIQELDRDIHKYDPLPELITKNIACTGKENDFESLTINEIFEMGRSQARGQPLYQPTRTPLSQIPDATNVPVINTATWKRQNRITTGTDVIMEDTVGSKRSTSTMGGQLELQKKRKTYFSPKPKSSSSGKKQARMKYCEDPDVMIEILRRLPLKSLLRSRCVCKWWNHLISEPLFISNYTLCNPQHQVSGFYMQTFLFLSMNPELRFIPCTDQIDAAPSPSLSFIEDENGVCINHSCNGLLLCSSFRCCLEEERKYYICKPTTRQYKPLPRPACNTVNGISIAFDPKRSPHYKVICICGHDLLAKHCQIKIYNSYEGCSWRDSGNPFVVLDEFLFNRGVFWKGALHWVGKGKFSPGFDVERELLFTTPMPPILEGWAERRLGYFGESGGHLYLIEIYGPQTTVFDVMEMSGDYSSWFVKYHVDLSGLAAQYPSMIRYNVQDIHRFVFSVLHLVHRNVGENEEEAILVLHIPGKLIPYNLRDNTLINDFDPSPHLMGMEENLGLSYRWESVHPFSNTVCYI
nr:f-box protein [Quercus suber]